MSLATDPVVIKLIDMAREEDLGDGDRTAALLPNLREAATFRLEAREAGVFAGRVIAPVVLGAYDEAIEVEWAGDGEDGVRLVDPPLTVAVIRGPVGSVLSAERVLLNFLQRLCGVATLTRRYVDAVAGTAAQVYDTRKTVPGWRVLDKYAVRCGGGMNHRQGLFDGVLLKDNHLAGVGADRLAGFVFDLLNRVDMGDASRPFIEVEADSLGQVEALLKIVGIDAILLDNFGAGDLRRAVALRDDLGLRGKVALEASGGITLETVRTVAETGVERISVGAITHSAPALDLSLERV